MSTPSLLGSYVHCKKRAWMLANRIRDGHDRSRSRWYDTRDLIGDNALYEVELPSGSRLDAWLPDEGLAIEFKSGVPKQADVIQVQAMYEELWMAGVSGFSFQLWYRSRYSDMVGQLATENGFATASVEGGYVAVRVDEPEPADLDHLAELRLHIKDFENGAIPDTPPATSLQCERCTYFDLCHL